MRWVGAPSDPAASPALEVGKAGAGQRLPTQGSTGLTAELTAGLRARGPTNTAAAPPAFIQVFLV